MDLDCDEDPPCNKEEYLAKETVKAVNKLGVSKSQWQLAKLLGPTDKDVHTPKAHKLTNLASSGLSENTKAITVRVFEA